MGAGGLSGICVIVVSRARDGVGDGGLGRRAIRAFGPYSNIAHGDAAAQTQHFSPRMNVTGFGAAQEVHGQGTGDRHQLFADMGEHKGVSCQIRNLHEIGAGDHAAGAQGPVAPIGAHHKHPPGANFPGQGQAPGVRQGKAFMSRLLTLSRSSCGEGRSRFPLAITLLRSPCLAPIVGSPDGLEYPDRRRGTRQAVGLVIVSEDKSELLRSLSIDRSRQDEDEGGADSARWCWAPWRPEAC